jgi:hypothetical protein
MFAYDEQQQQESQFPPPPLQIESDAPVDGKSSVCGASLAHLLHMYAPTHDLPTQVILPLLIFLRSAAKPPPPPAMAMAGASAQDDGTNLLVSSLFGEEAERASPLLFPPLSFESNATDATPIVLPGMMANTAMDTADDDEGDDAPPPPPSPLRPPVGTPTTSARWDRTAAVEAVEEISEKEERRRALHFALQTFEARLQPKGTSGAHSSIHAELRTFHTKGYLLLQSVVDLAGVDSVLRDIQASPETLEWEVIAPQFDGVAEPAGSVPREMASLKLPNLVDVVVTAAKKHNIFIELGQVHRLLSTKVLRSSAGVVAQKPHIDGPHPEPLHECEVRAGTGVAFVVGRGAFFESFLHEPYRVWPLCTTR